MMNIDESIVIKARNTHTIRLPISKPGEFVEWKWTLQAHDIAFSVAFHPKQVNDQSSTSNDQSVPRIILDSHGPVRTEHSSKPSLPDSINHSNYLHLTNEPGELVFDFDNTHSTFRSKTVQLSIHQSTNQPIPLGCSIDVPSRGKCVVQVKNDDDTYTCGVTPINKTDNQSINPPVSRTKIPSSDLYDAWSLSSRQSYLPQKETESSVNDRAMIGVDLFFLNAWNDAETFFASEMLVRPMFSVGFATIGFLRALMTWEKTDMMEANERLNVTRALLAPQMPHEGTLTSLSRMIPFSSMLGSNQSSNLSASELQATLITGETLILQSILALVEENVLSIIQAGLKIKQSHRLFQRAYQEYQARQPVDQKADQTINPIDHHVSGGIENGIGTFNVILSLLPPIVMRLLSFFGYSADAALGHQLLERAAKGRTMRSPLAACMLLFVHVVIPSFYTAHGAAHSAKAAELLDHNLKLYPGSALFLWLQGREFRNSRQLQKAVDALIASGQGVPEWKQLQHLTSYEIGLTRYMMLDFGCAMPQYEQLERESQWSKAFFLYQQAIYYADGAQSTLITKYDSASDYQSLTSDERRAKATDLFTRVIAACDRRFAGKQLGIEQFVMQRAQEWLNTGMLMLPTIEIVYLYYGFGCMDNERLESVLERINQSINQPNEKAAPSKQLLLVLWKGACLRALGRIDEAIEVLASIETKSKSAGSDVYILPFARFEIAAAFMQRLVQSTMPKTEADFKRIREMLQLASSFKAHYHFKNRLHLRVHLATSELKQLAKAEHVDAVLDEETPADDDLADELTPEQRAALEAERKAEQ